MTVAAAAAPSMFAVFRRRDFSLLWLAQLVSTAGSGLTDLAAGIYVWRETQSTLAVGLTLMVTAVPSLIVGLLAGVYRRSSRPATDHGLDLPDPGRRGRAHRGRHRDRHDRPRRPVCAAPRSTPGSSSSSIRRTTASSPRSPATRSSRPRTRSCRSRRSARRRSGSPPPVCWRAPSA